MSIEAQSQGMPRNSQLGAKGERTLNPLPSACLEIVDSCIGIYGLADVVLGALRWE